MRPLLTLLCCLGVCSVAMVQPTQAEVDVIVSPENPLRTVTASEVSDLYLGRTRSITEGGVSVAIRPYDMVDGLVRDAFFMNLNGMQINQVNAYWARLRFSGEVLQPSHLPDAQAMLDTVSHDHNAMGYVDATLVNDCVKILLRLGGGAHVPPSP